MTTLISLIVSMWLGSTPMHTLIPIASPESKQVAKTPIVEEQPVEQYEKIVPLESSENIGHLTTVSAYTSREEETDSDPCTSANGANICDLYAQGTRICAANGYAFGTILHVDGLGDCVVMDRMARKYGKDHIDWYYGYDLHSALQWGRQKRMVTVDE